MTTDQTTRSVQDSDRELDGALRATVSASNATAALTRILVAFDARRRHHETLAIAEAAQAASRAGRP